MSAFAPFVMDIYLSAFPDLAIYFSANPSMIQLSLTACTVGLAIGQMAFGSVSDSLGRKKPLIFSPSFIYLSLLCMY